MVCVSDNRCVKSGGVWARGTWGWGRGRDEKTRGERKGNDGGGGKIVRASWGERKERGREIEKISARARARVCVCVCGGEDEGVRCVVIQVVLMIHV